MRKVKSKDLKPGDIIISTTQDVSISDFIGYISRWELYVYVKKIRRDKEIQLWVSYLNDRNSFTNLRINETLLRKRVEDNNGSFPVPYEIVVEQEELDLLLLGR